MIYIAHPYANNPINKYRVNKIIRKLSARTEATFICPINAFGDLYKRVDYDKGMNYCLELLNVCSMAVFLGDWYSSKGCRIEHEYCKRNKIRIVCADELMEMFKIKL